MGESQLSDTVFLIAFTESLLVGN